MTKEIVEVECMLQIFLGFGIAAARWNFNSVIIQYCKAATKTNSVAHLIDTISKLGQEKEYTVKYL